MRRRARRQRRGKRRGREKRKEKKNRESLILTNNKIEFNNNRTKARKHSKFN